jgi:mannose-6-phosphate isomerase-like protein (cupin superfamily)
VSSTWAAPFPGAIGATRLRVYDTVAPDGLRGGTPHLHTVCTEAYAVVAGRGLVQTLDGDGYHETPLEPGALVWFTPGTVHRVVNGDGRLEILVLMQNAGLPEAGDLVVTFPDEVLADPDRYREAATLPPEQATTAGPDDAARRRRDLAVEGFHALRDGEAAGRRSLRRLHERAAALVRPHLDDWRRVWEAGPLAEALATGSHLDHLAAGRADHLAAASTHQLGPHRGDRRYGCCGLLGPLLAHDGAPPPGPDVDGAPR